MTAARTGRTRRSWFPRTTRRCRSPPGTTRSPAPSAITRWSSSPGRPARARPPSCPRSAWSWAGGRSATPSRGGSPPVRWPSGSPRSWSTELGDLVGYQVRFTRQASRATRLKVMTDGVLLAEIARDRDLRRYDTIIVDEAHERSLNIDFLLGYLRQLLPATAGSQDHHHLGDHRHRTVRRALRRPGRHAGADHRGVRPDLPGRDALPAAAWPTARPTRWPRSLDAVRELSAGRRRRHPGLPVRRAGDPRRGRGDPRRPSCRATEVLPLYARLSAAEQHRVFAPHPGRRIVLATNVAETSLTVPGIRYVVDPGTARISRYSARTKVQRLPIEPISQASANQRAGRCGRVAPGRVHPAVQRGGLPQPAGVHRAGDPADQPGLGDPADGRRRAGAIADFPFVEAPDRTQITDGLRLLSELGALADPGARTQPRLTDVGQPAGRAPGGPAAGPDAARGRAPGLPAGDADHRLRPVHPGPAGAPGRAPETGRRPAPPVLDADEPEPASCSLSVEGRRQAQRRTEPTAPTSWPGCTCGTTCASPAKSLSGNAFRRLCREEFLHFLRIREWQDLHGQLKQIARELDLDRNDVPAAAGPGAHRGADRAAVPGRPGRPTRGGPAAPAAAVAAGPARRSTSGPAAPGSPSTPGSSLARTQPPLVVAAEIVETSRLWARTVAPITAEQVEEVGQHLLKRSTPSRTGPPAAGRCWRTSTVSLLGVPIVARRRVGYGRINPAEAREIFIRSALVEGQWRTRHHFFAANQALRAEVEALEERTRRRDLLVDDETVLAFYAARVPDGIISAAHFDAWWKRARPADPGPAHHDLGRPDHRRVRRRTRTRSRRPGGWPATSSPWTTCSRRASRTTG